MTVFGLDSGALGDYTEQMIITSGFTYFKTPLRPASGNSISSAVIVDEAQGTFTRQLTAPQANRQTRMSTDDQAAHGVAFYFQARNGSWMRRSM